MIRIISDDLTKIYIPCHWQVCTAYTTVASLQATWTFTICSRIPITCLMCTLRINHHLRCRCNEFDILFRATSAARVQLALCTCRCHNPASHLSPMTAVCMKFHPVEKFQAETCPRYSCHTFSYDSPFLPFYILWSYRHTLWWMRHRRALCISTEDICSSTST